MNFASWPWAIVAAVSVLGVLQVITRHLENKHLQKLIAMDIASETAEEDAGGKESA